MIGRQVGAGVGVTLHLRKNQEIHIRLRDCRPSVRLIRQIYEIGFPSILMVGIGSLMTYFMNSILIAFTSTAVAVFGAYFKLQSFIFMPCSA